MDPQVAGPASDHIVVLRDFDPVQAASAAEMQADCSRAERVSVLYVINEVRVLAIRPEWPRKKLDQILSLSRELNWPKRYGALDLSPNRLDQTPAVFPFLRPINDSA